MSALVTYGYLAPREACPKAKAAARRALGIDDTLGEAFAPLGWMSTWYDHDWLDAERQFKRGIKLSPNYVVGHVFYALYLSIMRRPDEAVMKARAALELDPVSLLANSYVAATFTWAKQYDMALEQFHKILDMDPNYTLGRILHGELYLTTGRYEDAIAEYQNALAIAGETTYALGELGWAYGLAGRKDDALRVLGRLKELSEDRYVPFTHIAYVYLGLGEVDKGLEYMHMGYEERDQILICVRHPLAEPYRSHPAYIELCKKMGLEP